MKKVLLIATGGTIAMSKDESGKSIPALKGSDLLKSLPNLKNEVPSEIHWEVFEFSNVASSNMDPYCMLELSRIVNKSFEDPDLMGIIITHGTDTLEETAYFLELTVKDSRPVILTASQRDASESDSDGPRNLSNAIRISQDIRAMDRGVVITLNEEIHAARDVRKLHTSHVDAFRSGDLGALGSIDNGKVIWYRKPERSVKFALPERLAYITICKVFTGMSPKALECMLDDSTEGIVMEAFGRGNLPQELVPSISKMINKDIPVVITSRCLFGRTAATYGYSGGGADLEQKGALFAADLSTEKVRLLMSLALGQGIPKSNLREILSQGGVQIS